MSDVAGVVLAAGPSRRFGGLPKPLARLGGRTLLARAVRAACDSGLGDVHVVVGYRAEAVAATLAGLPVAVVENPDWQRGQSASVRAGLAALRESAEAAMFIPVDQPLLTAAVIDRLIDAYRRTGGPIVVPACGGRRGSPVLFARALFAELSAITGDFGGRQLFGRHEGEIIEVPLDDDEPLLDVDTAEDLERLRRRIRSATEGGEGEPPAGDAPPAPAAG